MSAAMTPERFWARVDQRGPDECWPWVGALTRGYGRIHYRGLHTPAHRMAYQLAVGPVASDLTIDHICFSPSCCNPAHLRPMSLVENSRRQRSAEATHCHNGHAFDEANTYVRSHDGRRQCRACNREAVRRYNARKVTA